MSDLDEATARRIVGWSLVVVQFALLGLLVIGESGDLWPTPAPVRVVALALVVVGCVIMAGAAWQIRRALTASPLPNDRTALMDRGWFGPVRHPIYTGLVTAAAGLALSRASILAVASLVGLGVLLQVKARFEETVLSQRFPGYADYAARTGRLLPRLRR